MANSIPVSTLILTLNEESNIARCLAALEWCDDIVVLDSHSTDGTVDIARSRGARVDQRPFDNFAAQRNHALENIEFRHDWVLHLDADEVVTAQLRDEIAQAVVDGDHAAFRIPSRLMFQGRWLRFSGMYPVYQVRLGRKDRLRFVQVGHGQRESLEGASVGTLRFPYLHYGFSKGLTDWIERHNRYSTDEAQHALTDRSAPASSERLAASDHTERRRALKRLSTRLPFRPFLRFLYMYLFRLGFLDGSPGWTYCRLMAMYEYWIVLKQRELSREAAND